MKIHKSRAVKIVLVIMVGLMCGSLFCAGLALIWGVAAIGSVFALHPIRAMAQALFASVNGAIAYITFRGARVFYDLYSEGNEPG